MARAAELRAAGDLDGARAAEQRSELAAAELRDLDAMTTRDPDGDYVVVDGVWVDRGVVEQARAEQGRVAAEQAERDREAARAEREQRDREVRARAAAKRADRDRKAAAQVDRRREQNRREEERARKKRLAERAAEHAAIQAGLTEAQGRQAKPKRRRR